jgi:atypical dual specificity phosphatase
MDTWWIDDPHLLGSRNPALADLEQLRRNGFEVLISLLKEDEQSPRYDVARAAALGFRRHNIPVKDFSPPTVAQLEHFLRLIADARGAKTIVHCEGGSGRTGTFAAAYWIAKGLKVYDAIARVREARCHAVETPEQEAALREFAAKHSSLVLITGQKKGT